MGSDGPALAMPESPRGACLSRAATVLEPAVDPRVDAALARLAGVGDLPAAEQVAVFADIHQRLSEVLADPAAQA